eukprot:12272243-Alexandrium_andersonii.AAC.1
MFVPGSKPRAGRYRPALSWYTVRASPPISCSGARWPHIASPCVAAIHFGLVTGLEPRAGKGPSFG